VSWQKKGVGHEVFLTEKGGPPKKFVQKGGGQLFYYSGEKCDVTIIATIESEQGGKFNSCT
jgi:hypothetical protein